MTKRSGYGKCGKIRQFGGWWICISNKRYVKSQIYPILMIQVGSIRAHKTLLTLLAEKDWRSFALCLPGRELKAFSCLFARRKRGTANWLQVDPINPVIMHVNKQRFWEFWKDLPSVSAAFFHFPLSTCAVAVSPGQCQQVRRGILPISKCHILFYHKNLLPQNSMILWKLPCLWRTHIEMKQNKKVK